MAWLQVWTFIDEDGRTRTLAEALWPGQRRFLEALLSAGHVLSVKSRKRLVFRPWSARTPPGPRVSAIGTLQYICFRIVRTRRRSCCARFVEVSRGCPRSCVCHLSGKPRRCSRARLGPVTLGA